MSSNYQFPPSSPLMSGSGGYDEEHDPFAIGSKGEKGMVDRGRVNYPTPNPSSSVGRSSSLGRGDEDEVNLSVKPKKSVSFNLVSSTPAKQRKENTFGQQKPQKVKINRDFNILDPDAKVLRVPLLTNKTSLLIGRSSKACDFYLNAKDKTISRTHISISYDQHTNQMNLHCLGYNGFAMRIPKPCVVYGTNNKNDYILMENKSAPLSVDGLERLGLTVTPRTITLESNHTEFVVNRNESVTLPKLNNVLIEIRNNLILLNPVEDEEDLTDDETPVLINKTKPAETMVDSSPTIVKPVYHTPDHVNLQSLPHTPSKTEFKCTSEESTPISYIKRNFSDSSIKKALGFKPFEIHQDQKPQVSNDDSSNNVDMFIKESTPTTGEVVQMPTTPLGDKSNTFSKPNTPKRRAHSEEPQKPMKKKKKSQQPQKVEIDQSCIEGIQNIPEINNILVNHLAFSRLSSTPASFLNTISAITSELSLKQLRVILHNVKSIGIIYREGKDAAGKPLEEEYYYMPENDDDTERPKLVSSIKGHGGLRSCRRTHKQYYWKKPAPIKK
ncbi:DEHA2E13970p [Debaryomyces hansenii CBS767]|uniref:DEHA2E13970p n=1 Tax=Debaryomyces hansenii (strain ATCC 36239 / CBS 767 / BCRC 21394 / JCM 1990 / NBRC 0083 / IGC 2968) TaxID=284592 RepID=Q6BPF7_DEBHA|nr:DEHA2E13970p [Debaryomyces hansenii CBS767]CAG88155.2 DEHA2E13970p [Debaryomyces hansenii CBS767]|eukprot:XP_459913.2 DEHA2E13970p [Debaryomyces hansenii CBS767]